MNVVDWWLKEFYYTTVTSLSLIKTLIVMVKKMMAATKVLLTFFKLIIHYLTIVINHKNELIYVTDIIFWLYSMICEHWSLQL